MASADARALPNILITGTPGTGKSTTAAEVVSATGLRHVNVGDVAKEKQLYENWDDEYECPVLDEDRVVDELEEIMSEGGVVVEYHGCSFFPQRWFDAVFVLRTDNTILYDRLSARGYSGRKLTENVECEIFQTILEEALESYSEDIVFELNSDTVEQLESNVERITAWARGWKAQRA